VAALADISRSDGKQRSVVATEESKGAVRSEISLRHSVASARSIWKEIMSKLRSVD
jgi:hypothetical protein